MTDLVVRWSRQNKGWIAFRDPETGVWDEVWHRDMPQWRYILLANIGVGRKRRDEPSVDPDELRCCWGPVHEPCKFGLGQACLKGDACTNPHHYRWPWLVSGFHTKSNGFEATDSRPCQRRTCMGDGRAWWEITAPAGFSTRRPTQWVCAGCLQQFLAIVRRTSPMA